MLTIICGDDTPASRKYYLDLQASYHEKGYFVERVESSQLLDSLKEEVGTVTLFDQKKVYVVENLTRIISRKTSGEVKVLLKQAAENPDLIVLDWESSKTAREITLKEAQIKEFKLPTTIFKLLEECYPGNLRQFLSLYDKLCEHFEPEFVFAMLARHTKQLLLASEDVLPNSSPSWQRAKLHGQASKWKKPVLIAFYDGLARIDVNQKTGKDTLGMKKAIDVLACFCLR